MHHAVVWDRRADRSGRARPEVLVSCHLAADVRALLRQIGAGLEEEGVPFRVAEGGLGSAAELAYAAAQASVLDVGIGIDATGNVCVHQAKLPPDSPALSGPPESARILGHNAARLVTGMPFREISGECTMSAGSEPGR
jgi:hypothetical protein